MHDEYSDQSKSLFPQYVHGIKCPFCESRMLRVVRTDPKLNKPNKKYRRLVCESCQRRSTSYEGIAWGGDGRKDDD